MHIHHNYLRAYRKQTDITASDIGFLLNLPDFSNISRWEKGHRTPSIEMILLYHLLFKVPIEALFERQKNGLSNYLMNRIELLLKELKQQEQSPKVISRIAFLTDTYKRISA
jgi:transcriptional regulator with XRE-family HTH domain